MEFKKLQIEQTRLQLDVGSGLTLQEFAKISHLQSDGYVTVATKNAAGEWTKKGYASNVWVETSFQNG